MKMNIVRVISAAALLLVPAALRAADAVEVKCEWQNSSSYPAGFYKAGGFEAKIDGAEALFTDKSYFERRYAPCWSGSSASCYFVFPDGDGRPYRVEKAGPAEIYLELTNYFTAMLTMAFDKPLKSLNPGDTVSVTLKGDDGDGVTIDGDRFACVVK